MVGKLGNFKLNYGDKKLIMPGEKTIITSQTNLGEVVHYQFHEAKVGQAPIVVEITDNFLFEFVVLKEDKNSFEEYLFPKAYYAAENVPFYCQTDAEINGLDCRWCGDWNKCCNGGIEGIKDKSGKITCSDNSNYGYNNCCFAASSFMVSQSGKSVGKKRLYFADLINNSDLRDGVSSIANLNDNEDLRTLINLIKAKTPLVAGVFYSDRYEDDDNIVSPKNHKLDGTNSPTCHFIVIIGYGINKEGQEYFKFYDPASKENGNSDYNILIINKVENYIKGKRFNDTKQTYILTEFRIP